MRIISISLILFFLCAPVSLLGAAAKPYASGKILTIEKKARTRVLYYLVNTPVTQDDPYFEVSVQINDTVYLTEFNPRHSSDTLPDDWQAGTSVQARVEKRHLFLKRPSGDEVDLIVVKKSKAELSAETPHK